MWEWAMNHSVRTKIICEIKAVENHLRDREEIIISRLQS